MIGAGIKRFTAAFCSAALLLSLGSGAFCAQNVRAEETDGAGAVQAAEEFFGKLAEGDLQEAAKSCSVVEAIRLGLFSVRGEIFESAAEITGANMDVSDETKAILTQEAHRLTDEAMKLLVQGFSIASKTTKEGSLYYLTGTVDQVAADFFSGFDFTAVVDPAAVRDAYAEEYPEEWAGMEAIANDSDRLEAELVRMTPFYVDAVIEAFRALEPVTSAWTMTMKETRGNYTVHASDLDLVTEREPIEIPQNDAASFWARDWYGWWVITDAAGNKEDFNNYWFDCCARITLDENGDGTVIFWDEDTTYSDWLAKVNIHVDQETGMNGAMTSTNGVFWGEPVGADEWKAMPGEYVAEDLLGIESVYDDGEGSFTYMIYLRPWGTLWDDLEEDDLPYYYYDWYLPLIEDGAEMPLEMELPEPVG